MRTQGIGFTHFPQYLQLFIFCCLLSSVCLPALAKASSASLEAFFDQHSLPMLWIEPETGDILDANAAAASFYGYSIDALRSKSITEINTFSQEQVAKERALTREQGRNYFIFRHQLADGEVRTVEVYSHPYEHQGRTQLLSVIHDITPGRNLDHGLWHYQQRLEDLVEERTLEANRLNRRMIQILSISLMVVSSILVLLMWSMRKRRKAEYEAQRFKTISEQALYGNAIIDLEGRVVYVNPFFAQAHGYTPEELVGQQVSVFHAPEQMSEVEELLKTLKQQGQFSPKEIWHCDRNGQRFPMLMSGILMRDEQGQPVYMASTALDLTNLYKEREAYQASLVQAKEDAEAASQAKSEFLANMSHEIRTPMNGILGMSELGLKEQDVAQMRHQLKRVNQSGRLLLGIINDILDFSKIEAGKLELDLQPFQLEQIRDELNSLFTSMAESKGLELRTLSEPEQICSTYLFGDAHRLRQVLINLLGNALKFTDAGTVTLKIQQLEVTPEDDCVWIEFRVTDTGSGICEEHQAKLFQAFTQADTSITRKHGGTGLGLVISQRLVQLMGGEKIRIQSQVGHGSTFYFALPFRLCTAEETAIFYQSQAQQNGAQKLLSGRVLLVEDNAINQEVVSAHLRNFGVDFLLANNGQEAVEMTQQHSFDLVLMDIQMPLMDGYQATRLIRESDQDLPIIAVTAAAMVEDKNRALAAGMNDHLSKPIEPDQLYRLLSSYLSFAPALQTDIDVIQKPTLLLICEDKGQLKRLAKGASTEYRVKVAVNPEQAEAIIKQGGLNEAWLVTGSDGQAASWQRLMSSLRASGVSVKQLPNQEGG